MRRAVCSTLPKRVTAATMNTTQRDTGMPFTTQSGGTAPAVDKLHVVMYTYVEGMLTKRVPHRSSHLAYVEQFVNDGRLVAGGAWEDASGGMIVLRTTDSDAQRFIRDDPYVTAGLVTRSEVRPWLVVVGTAKQEPHKP